MTALHWLGAALSLFLISGFAPEGPRGGGVDALDHLSRAPRWSMTEGSLLNTGERGLGGGLEYAVDDSICQIDFVDEANCDDVFAAIAASLRLWESGHPDLRFVNITGQVKTGFPLAVTGERGQGAEIDFFAQTGREFPPFYNVLTTGYTMFYERAESGPVRLTNGQEALFASRIESADVRVNAQRCYYINPGQAVPACLHLPSVLLHEVGHALGLGHPEDLPRYNLDTDARPQTPVTIDCEAPEKSLVVSPFFDGAAVMVGRDVQGPGRSRRGLTPDDAAGRDALYPSCGIVALPRFEGRWGAYAVSSGKRDGRAQFQPDEASARAAALSSCQAHGEACELVAAFKDCFAYAEDRAGGAAKATSPRSDYARANAVLACGKTGRACKVRTDFCAFE